MLPVFRAISYQGVLQGGKTRPWLVLVDDLGTPKPYVVKLFNEGENNRNGSVINEVIGNVLAKDFSLLAPKAALIEMDINFEMTINDPVELFRYENADQRIKFGCVEIPSPNLFRVGMHTKRQIKSKIEIDNLFAYDNLIRNGDRGHIRPNLILTKRDAYLIDHEVGFKIDGMTLQDVLDKNWASTHYSHHIFYDYLKRSRKTTKVDYFNEFEENLIRTNFDKLNGYLDQLHKFGYYVDRHRYTIQYFNSIKKYSANFVDLLRGIIS